MKDKEKNFLKKWRSIREKGHLYYMITRIIIAFSVFMISFSLTSFFLDGNIINNSVSTSIKLSILSFTLAFLISRDSWKNSEEKYHKLIEDENFKDQ
ncbi:hypothetical protein [Clostridium sp. JN-9]|uniref:hypothetical protein n=1 Tax=Clostridium sp. JN-9 TaxID=2507159 RepID=UPI000FFE1992|nr:hypothetical protein [Clostridium sp. JN-9]QAT40985.1 hypothetical protein EQM05_12325 [Clostridium sp. JN-9]